MTEPDDLPLASPLHEQSALELFDLNLADAEEAKALLIEAVQHANACIREINQTPPKSSGGASTIACTFVAGTVVGVHVGECRLDALEGEHWVPKTREHTLADEVDMPSDLAGPHNPKRLVSRVVGLTENIEVDSFQFDPQGPASVLLSTPGAWVPLDPEVKRGPLLGFNTDELVMFDVFDRYTESGERDNATVVYGHFRG